MSPYCKDNEKYKVVDDVIKEIEQLKSNKIKIDNQEIHKILTINGVRFTFEYGSWGLIRASNTSANLTLRFEADSERESKRIKELFRAQLSPFIKNLDQYL